MVKYIYHLTHNLKVAGSNPAPAINKTLQTYKIEVQVTAVARSPTKKNHIITENSHFIFEVLFAL